MALSLRTQRALLSSAARPKGLARPGLRLAAPPGGARGARLRPLAWSGLAALLALAGCSEFPDPYTNRCPDISELELTELTSVGARLTWQTDLKSLTRVTIRAPDGLEEIVEDRTPKNQHSVALANLFPDTGYRVEILPDRGLGTCAAVEVLEFRTRRLGEDSAPATTPSTDPEDPITPCAQPGTCPPAS